MCFYLVGFGSLLTCGTIFGSVDFSAGFEEEKEAEPEDAAPPEFRVNVEALLLV